MTEFLSKEGLFTWLRQIAGERKLIAPVRMWGITLFRPVGSPEDIALDIDNTDLSAKDWFFPPSEALFTVEQQGGGRPLITPATEDREAVLFGLRPCDALAISHFDLPFLAEPADPLYRERREKTVLVGVACARARPECFCTSAGTAPNDPSHMDILLTEAGDGYALQAVTEKGRQALGDTPLESRDIQLPPTPQPDPVPLAGINDIARQVFDAPYWDRLADRCIHCNLCAYVCPDCYCFDIRDYSAKGKIERVRCWESCQSAGFTRLAGGHDPRSTKGARLRQRFYHKFLYFPEQFGPTACTGCGRCVRACPVNIDIREVAAEMQKAAEQVALETG
ncbi:MAG: 4Fe-4S dicluster domain-containing protein [Dehalococcoidia bacterium]